MNSNKPVFIVRTSHPDCLFHLCPPCSFSCKRTSMRTTWVCFLKKKNPFVLNSISFWTSQEMSNLADPRLFSWTELGLEGTALLGVGAWPAGRMLRGYFKRLCPSPQLLVRLHFRKAGRQDFVWIFSSCPHLPSFSSKLKPNTSFLSSNHTWTFSLSSFCRWSLADHSSHYPFIGADRVFVGTDGGWDTGPAWEQFGLDFVTENRNEITG